MNGFKRGLDPKEAMGIGMAGILKEIGGKIINLKELEKHKKQGSPENIVILLAKGKYKIVKNQIRLDLDNNLPEGPESELYDMLLKLQEAFRKYGADWFNMPILFYLVYLVCYYIGTAFLICFLFHSIICSLQHPVL